MECDGGCKSNWVGNKSFDAWRYERFVNINVDLGYLSNVK